jgi:hypothetical protein
MEGVMKAIRGSFLVLILLLFSFGSSAFTDELDDSDECSCKGGTISIGSTEYDVIEKCGKPTYYEGHGTVWVYNFGPTEFILYITFVDGRAERIQFGGYGYDKTD